MNASGMLTVGEVAARLNTTERFVRRLVSERRIAFHKVGRHVRVLASDVDDYIAAGRVEALVGSRSKRRAA